MNLLKYFRTIALIVFPMLFLLSCGDNSVPPMTEISLLKAHQWYYFSPLGLFPVEAPQQAPEVAAKPWTEAIRLANAGSSSTDNCGVVNRLGIMDFSSGKPTLYRDPAIFQHVTVDTLVFTKDGPIFNLYQNDYFNKQQTSEKKQRPLLVKYDKYSKLCIPVLTYEDLDLPDNAQITSIIPQKGSWLATVKTTHNDRVDFSYISFSTVNEDGSIPTPANIALTKKEISNTEFRNAQQPLKLSMAPEALQLLFAQVPHTFEFYLTSKEEGQIAPVMYDNTSQQSLGQYIFQGYSYVSSKGAVALFSDGTTYISKSLLYTDGLQQAEEVIAFLLPKLPAGFIYGDFTISGDTLYAAWEESDFYKTGRSGLIAVNLREIGKKLEKE